MDKNKLQEILESHQTWLKSPSKGHRADLRGTDLREADLYKADLRKADLRGADLQGADLRGADLDFSSGIPLWCGGSNIKLDSEHFKQLLWHFINQDYQDLEPEQVHIHSYIIAQYGDILTAWRNKK